MDKRQEILEFTYMCSPFYQTLMEEKGLSISEIQKRWEDVPVVDKMMLLDAGKEIVPFSYYPKLVRGDLLSEIVSCFNGSFLKVYWSEEEKISTYKPLWKYRQEWYDIHPEDLCCYFYVTDNPEGDKRDYQYGEKVVGISKINLGSEKIQEIYEMLLVLRPVWIVTETSILLLLAKYIQDHQKENISSLKYIEISGEICTGEERDWVEKVFQCPVRNSYSCEEVGCIAYECPCGSMHIIEENVYAEICRDGHPVPEREEGNIVVSSMWNHVMPFVRYDTDDVGSIKEKTCSCGRKGKLLEITKGRKGDLIRYPDGKVLHPSEFWRIFLRLRNRGMKINQYQVIQRDYDLFDVYIICDEREAAIISAFRREMNGLPLDEAQFQFHFQEDVYSWDCVDINSFFRCMVKE